MGEVVQMQNRGVDAIRAEFLGAYDTFREDSVRFAWEQGCRLLEIKDILPHGQFEGWCDMHLPVKARQRRKWMMLAKRYSSTVLPPLSINEALGYEEPKRPRSGNATHDNDDEWYTPPALIEACREALGAIDLDPASNEIANRVVKAARFFTVEDDGLAQEWEGRVFLNPPYSKEAGKREFIAKLADSAKVTAAVVVLSYDFSASWFEPLRGWYSAICLMYGRVQFYKENPGDGHDPALGTSVVYLGSDVAAFSRAFSGLGEVVVPYG